MSSPVHRALAGVRRAAQLAVGRCRILLVDRSRTVPRVQGELYAGEVRRMELAQPSGFASIPPEGTEGIVVAPSGDRAQAVVVSCIERIHRPPLLPDEACIYATQGGAQIHVSRDGVVRIFGEVVRIAGDLVVEGSIVAAGDVSDGVSSMQAMRDVYNVHTHPSNGSPPDVPMGGGA